MAGRPGWADDEVSDSDFLSSGPPKNQGSGNNDYQQRRQQLLEERRRIEERTLQSSKMSLGLVYESEKIGLSTAEDLVKQGEKLQNVDRNLDSMNSTMKVTQKHLTSMKSLFGGIKNYFSKTPDTHTIPSSQSVPGSIGIKPNGYKSSLTETIGQVSSELDSRSADNHPALVRRGLGSNPFDEEDEMEKNGPKSGYAARSRQVDQQLDNNLGELDLGLNRLKNLALGLGNEIESQNEMIERITTKAERAEDTIGHQNRQMKQILKK